MTAALLCATPLAACDEHRGTTSPAYVAGIVVVVEPEAALAAERSGVDLNDTVDRALRRVQQRIDVPDTVISVLDRPGRVDPETGTGGFTDPVTAEVFVYVDASRSDFAAVVEEWVAPMVAHELHHAARIENGPGYGFSLERALVTEGLADAFSVETFGHPPPPWTDALAPRSLCRWWRRALHRDVYDHDEWFFGTGRIPRAAGYSIGWVLVRRYLRAHPSETAAGLVSAPAHKVLAGVRLCGVAAEQ